MKSPKLFPLKVIEDDRGSVRHGIKQGQPTEFRFGELYFSEVKVGKVKGWKQHKRMTLNLFAASGAVRVVVVSNLVQPYAEVPIEPTVDVELSINNHARLQVPPGWWVAFKGIGAGENVLLNFADISHDPEESNNLPVTAFNFTWGDK